MRFEYVAPNTIEEAISVLVRRDGKAKVLAGGTDLLIQMRQKTVQADRVVDIGELPGLSGIGYDETKGLTIGATTTIREVERSPTIHRHYPVIASAASRLGSIAVRNLGTLGGNLCNAAPSAEMAPPLIGLSATLTLRGPDGERSVPIEGFFTGPGQTVLETGEILTRIEVPPPPAHTRGVYLKHAIRGSIDLAIVGVAVVATVRPETGICEDIRIVLGAVAPTPMRAVQAEAILKGKRIDDEAIRACALVASSESRPITDVRASAWYRTEMVKVLTREAFRRLLSDTA